jgi:hypothetical protein
VGLKSPGTITFYVKHWFGSLTNPHTSPKITINVVCGPNSGIMTFFASKKVFSFEQEKDILGIIETMGE